ncbi:MAG: hypothetical protein K6G89_08780 [Clostridia bacterium]|nr:hypothetical protein [Clostridia bacterium]
MKKLLSLTLVAAILLSMLSSGIVLSFAEGDAPAYGISNAECLPGETFEVIISVVNNPGIISIRNNIAYDTYAFELVKVEDLGLFAGYTTPAAAVSSPYILRWADSLASENNVNNGDFAVITFKAKDTAAPGSYSVSVNHIEARTAVGGKVTFANAETNVVILDKLIGDADGDGEVTDWDGIMFERYLAAWNVDIDLSVLDIDKDGEVSDWDAIILSRYLAGWNIELNPEPDPTPTPEPTAEPTAEPVVDSNLVFPEDNTVFDVEFAKEVIKLNNSQAAADVKASLNAIGFKVQARNQRNYNKAADDQSHTVAYTIGTSTVNYKGKVRNAVIVVIRGTSGGEWYSNLDFVPSHNNDALYAENFLQASNEVFGTLKMRTANIEDPVFLFTGHSRGAACADLLGLLYNEEFGSEDVFVYSFATPGCIRSEEVNQNSDNIFNIVNPADFIIWLPPQELGFFRPGTDIVLPDSNRLVSTINNLYRPISNMLSGLTIQQYYEEKHSLKNAGLDPENGKSIAEELTTIAVAAGGGGNINSVLSEVLSINSKSDLYPIRQFAMNAALSGKLDTLQKQHEVATYSALLENFVYESDPS